MIMLTDEIHAWGHIATIHYTHPPRSVVMQASLAGRVDFTTTGAFRGIVFFTSFIAGGVETDLMAPPIFGASQFRANDLSEVRGRLMADLCGARAVISQFNRVATMSTADSVDAAAESRMVAFHRPGNGTIAYKHIVKVFAGGRTVSEQEAIDMARSNATGFFLDVDQLEMKVTTNVEHAGRAQRVDTETGEFVVSPMLPQP
jgi:hypothetical protein